MRALCQLGGYFGLDETLRTAAHGLSEHSRLHTASKSAQPRLGRDRSSSSRSCNASARVGGVIERVLSEEAFVIQHTHSLSHTHIAHIRTDKAQSAQHETSEKGERGSARAGAQTTVETIVALRTGTVAFFIASAASADIAVLRKALESSPIAQSILVVLEVKVHFMIVEGVVWGLVCCPDCLCCAGA